MGLDVFEEESPPESGVSEGSAKQDKVIATHHSVADTAEASEDKGNAVLEPPKGCIRKGYNRTNERNNEARAAR